GGWSFHAGARVKGGGSPLPPRVLVDVSARPPPERAFAGAAPAALCLLRNKDIPRFERGATMNKPLSEHPKLLLDPYLAWCDKEAVPITEDFGIDLLAIPTAPWARFGVDGAIAHLKGRGDFVSIFLLDLAPGAQTSPQKHLYEEVVYVMSGYGSTTVETSDGRKHSFEWGPKSLFALPLNARYQHFNTSGRERARLASVNNLCLQLNLFHNEQFI